jgi:LacI family transcriptional regulator
VLTGSLDEDPVQEKNLARALIDRGVDGLLVVPAGTDHSYLIGEQRAGTQIVFLDRNPSLWMPIQSDRTIAGAPSERSPT